MERAKFQVQESGIKVAQPHTTIDEGVKLTSEQSKILPHSFITLIVGTPGSGKSHLLFEFISNEGLYFQKFDKILFVTPVKLAGMSEVMIENSNWIRSFDIQSIYTLISDFNNNFKKERRSNVLLILDDVIGEIFKCRMDPSVLSLFYNRRHILRNGTISIIVTTQKYIMMPPQFRSVLTSLIIFRVGSVDWDKVKKEVAFEENKKLEIIKHYAWKQPHSFIYFRLDTSEVFLNFDKVLFGV